MSIARHHAEWLSLVEANGSFLSLQVLLNAFPQGLEAHDSEHYRLLKQAYTEWQNENHDPAIHQAWIKWVLQETLQYPDRVLLQGQDISQSLQVKIAEYQEILRPDFILKKDQIELLITYVSPEQGLEKTVKNSRWKASPATRMMELLHGCNVRLGLLTNGEQWMLVNAPKGETTGFISWYANLWTEEKLTLRSFRSLLGINRFFGVPQEESLSSLLAQSKDSQQEVTDQLGYQVRKAVEVLVQKIDRIDLDFNRKLLENISDTQLYEAALFVMMRLVFLFSAEEKGLLLLGDRLYDQNYAVSTLRAELREMADNYGEEILERRHDAWCRLLATFRAVYQGVEHSALRLPAYGGDLFNPDKFPFLEGRLSPRHKGEGQGVRVLPIDNRTVLHLLEALQILQIKVPGGGVEPRRLSFRALDVEQIGHVYEGLLDHTAIRAKTTVLGLIGTKDKNPEISLEELETYATKGEKELIAFLKKVTGKSESALKKLLPSPPSPLSQKARGEQKQLSSILPSPSGRGVGGEGLTPHQESRYLIACHNDIQLWQRIKPFYQLIRFDTFDFPLIIPAGSVYVTQGSDRRETGTHYTPKSLTEEIVKYTLQPLVYEGVAEGKPQEEWVLKPAKELLNLKICDPTMGSGAFLVQVCRYLGQKLVESWNIAENSPLTPTLSQKAREELFSSILPSPSGRGAGGEGKIPEILLEKARELRKNQTPTEEILWECLRNRRLNNAKFRRQHNIGRYIADFYCHEARLIVELDGSSHDDRQQEDEIRDNWCKENGFQVLRFQNDEVFQNLETVLTKISSKLPSPSGRGVGGEGKKYLVVTPEGELSQSRPDECLIPEDENERLMVAKRIIAERCIYGVDKNPLAVEMAKLSLWLETLQKDKPFTFVDHALKCGDSLIGANLEQLKNWNLDTEGDFQQLGIAGDDLQRMLTEAIDFRLQIEAKSVNTPQDQQEKAYLLTQANARIKDLKDRADLLVSSYLTEGKKQEQQNLRLYLLMVAQGKADLTDYEGRLLPDLNQLRPFHWDLEFPEVFLNMIPPSPPYQRGEKKKEKVPLTKGDLGGSGFHAIVGNPPFMWGNRISSYFADVYRDWLSFTNKNSNGNSDLVAYFIRCGFDKLNNQGFMGLITTNTVCESDTRATGLDYIYSLGALIYRAERDKTWSGSANVRISEIFITKTNYLGEKILDSKSVSSIATNLYEEEFNWKPKALIANSEKSFKGVDFGGEGFLITAEEKDNILSKYPNESNYIWSFINASILTSEVNQIGNKWIINFSGMSLEEAYQVRQCMKIVEEKVLPYRKTVKDQSAKEKWWLYNRERPALYNAISNCKRVLVNPVVAKYITFSFLPTRIVFTNALNVFPLESYLIFACLQSSIHEFWALKEGSTLRTDPRYNPTDCFETFPFPDIKKGSEIEQKLERIGEEYYHHRQAIMTKNQEGLTKTYNRFHNPDETDSDIIKLRELHREMDNLVAQAYGWLDLALTPNPSPTERGENGGLNHDFHETKQGLRYTICEEARREILDRLLQLNHTRYEEEIKQGLHNKKGKKKAVKSKTKKVKNEEQLNMF